MTPISGLSLLEAEALLEQAHPGWKLDHHGPRPGEYATIPEGTWAGLGLPLWAPSVETIEPVIGEWERRHPGAAA